MSRSQRAGDVVSAVVRPDVVPSLAVVGAPLRWVATMTPEEAA